MLDVLAAEIEIKDLPKLRRNKAYEDWYQYGTNPEKGELGRIVLGHTGIYFYAKKEDAETVRRTTLAENIP